MRYKAPDIKYETLGAYTDALSTLIESGHAFDIVKLSPNNWGRRIVQEFGTYDKFPIGIDAKLQPLIEDLKEYGFRHTASNPYSQKYKERAHKLLHTNGGHIELHARTHPIASEFIPPRADMGFIGLYTLDAKMCWSMDKDCEKMNTLLLQIATATISLCNYLVDNNIPAYIDQAGGWNHAGDKSYTVWSPPPGFVPNIRTRKIV